jgi:hypothetical protein
MKKIFFIILLSAFIFNCKAQTYPLNTNTDVPTGAYIKDINNELLPYEGTWQATWGNKTFTLYLIKIKKLLDHKENNPYYKDVLVGKFKVLDSSVNILFDNTNLPDNDTKIEGGGFIKNTDKYLLRYSDVDICNMSGWIYINFTNPTKTQLNWKFSDMTDIITPDCPYYNANPFPQPLPANIVLTKQ